MIQLHFGEIIPTMADWVQLIISFLTLVATSVMAFVAWKALSTWKDQKKHDLVNDAKAEIDVCVALFEKLTNVEEILYKYTNESNDSYKGAYKQFFFNDFVENINSVLIAEAIQSYKDFKQDTTSERTLLLYKSSRVTTFKNDSSFLKKELGEIQDFYSELLIKHNSFSYSFDMLELAQHFPEEKRIEESKEILKELEGFKQITLELSSKGLKLLTGQTN